MLETSLDMALRQLSPAPPNVCSQYERQNECFLAKAQIISDFAARAGIILKPSYDGQLRFFSLFPEESPRRTKILFFLKAMAEACQKADSANTEIETSQAMLKTFLECSRLKVPSELLGLIEPGDSIHVYDRNHELIYGSLGFFQLTSYSLEELMCNTWPELFTSDMAVVKNQFMSLSHETASGKRRSVTDTSYIANHVEYELRSPERRAAAMIPRLHSPVFAIDNSIAGYLCFSKFLSIPNPDSHQN